MIFVLVYDVLTMKHDGIACGPKNQSSVRTCERRIQSPNFCFHHAYYIVYALGFQWRQRLLTERAHKRADLQMTAAGARQTIRCLRLCVLLVCISVCLCIHEWCGASAMRRNPDMQIWCLLFKIYDDHRVAAAAAAVSGSRWWCRCR